MYTEKTFAHFVYFIILILFLYEQFVRWWWHWYRGPTTGNHKYFLRCLWPFVREIIAYYDVVAIETHQIAGEILVLEELFITAIYRFFAAHGQRIQFPI